ncbi:ATP-binding protein [Streptomyces sp. NPDC059071]|uniref:ATP-binding protein n=1 Tax=unclassified Streptomyces TaxID=2593676 RepID=UPI0036647A03
MSEEDRAVPQRLRRIIRASLNEWRRPDLAEDAELLLTELVTNAFRYADAPTVDVRVYRQGALLQIEVNDHSPHGRVPRPAGLYDDHGRGLFLVDALAHSWGVSDDRTTTWCTLPLAERPLEIAPVATAPVRHETALRLPADPSALTLAGIQGRTHLTLLNWSGNQHAAVSVLHVLVHNALQHGITPGPGQAIAVWLRVTQARELLIDVEDPNPEFPDFDKAVAGELGRGLWGARRLGAAITWMPNAPGDTVGKIVRAVMQPGEVDL